MEKKDWVEKSDAFDAPDFNGPPFGVTLDTVAEYCRRAESDTLRVHNEPVRDVTKQSCLDFLLEPLPEEDEAALTAIMKSVEEAVF